MFESLLGEFTPSTQQQKSQPAGSNTEVIAAILSILIKH